MPRSHAVIAGVLVGWMATSAQAEFAAPQVAAASANLFGPVAINLADSGTATLVYGQRVGTASLPRVAFTRVSSGGTVISPKLVSSKGTDDDSDAQHQIAGAPEGPVAVVWSRQSTSIASLLYRRIAVNGALGPVRVLASTAEGWTRGKGVARRSSGGSTVLYDKSIGASNSGLLAYTLNSASQIQTHRRVTADLPQATVVKDIASNASGASIIVWAESTEAGTLVRARGIAANLPLGPLRTLSVAGTQATQATAAINDDGRIVVAWIAADANFANPALQARVIAADGSVGPLRNINLSADGQEPHAFDLAIAPSGEVRLAWETTFSFGTGRVLSRTIDATGELGPLQALAAQGDSPSVGVDGNGNFHVAYSAGDAFAADRFAAVRSIPAGGVPGAQKRLSSRVNYDGSPAIAVNAAGQVVVSWLDFVEPMPGSIRHRVLTSFGP
jgi:hypothetical protein